MKLLAVSSSASISELDADEPCGIVSELLNTSMLSDTEPPREIELHVVLADFAVKS